MSRLPLKNMLDIAKSDNPEWRENRLQGLNDQAQAISAEFLRILNDSLFDDQKLSGEVLVGEIAVFRQPRQGQVNQFATFVASVDGDMLDGYQDCIKSIQRASEGGRGGPLVLEPRFYARRQAYLECFTVESPASAIDPKECGKFAFVTSDLSEEALAHLEEPEERFGHFSQLVHNRFGGSGCRVVASATLDAPGADPIRQEEDVRTAIFVVLMIEDRHMSGAALDERSKCLLAQRLFSALGSVVAGNLLVDVLFGQKTELEEAKIRLIPKLKLPKHNPQTLGFSCNRWDAFFSDPIPEGPPHNCAGKLHDDIKRYLMRVTERNSGVDLESWLERNEPGQVHELVKRVFLLDYPLNMNSLALIAASVLQIQEREIDENQVEKLLKQLPKLCTESDELELFTTTDHRQELVEALVDLFFQMRPEPDSTSNGATLKLTKSTFSVTLAPFDAFTPRRDRTESLMDKLSRAASTQGGAIGGNLFLAIHEVQKLLRLSGLDGQPPNDLRAKQVCVLNVVPRGHQCCTFEFRSTA